jgi:hypothetical protein
MLLHKFAAHSSAATHSFQGAQMQSANMDTPAPALSGFRCYLV